MDTIWIRIGGLLLFFYITILGFLDKYEWAYLLFWGDGVVKGNGLDTMFCDIIILLIPLFFSMILICLKPALGVGQ